MHMDNSKQWTPCALFLCWTSGIPLLSTVLVSASLRNVFTRAHSSLSAHGFPWCLAFGPLDNSVIQSCRLPQKSVKPSWKDISLHLPLKNCNQSDQDADVQEARPGPRAQINRNVTMDDVLDKRVLVYIALACPCVRVRAVAIPAGLGPLEYPDKSH